MFFRIFENKNMKKDKRIHQIHLVVSDAELEIFKNKAKNYNKLSSMIRDAVVQFNDQATKRSLESLNELSELINSFGVELSKQGGNLNQVVKRANELIYAGELDKRYFEEVLSPQIEKTQKLVFEVKKQQKEIFKRLMRL